MSRYSKTLWASLGMAMVVSIAGLPVALADTYTSPAAPDSNYVLVWDDANFWTGGSNPYPALAGDIAQFLTNQADPNYTTTQTISLNGQAITLGQLQWAGQLSNWYLIDGGGGTLTFDSSTALPFADPNSAAIISIPNGGAPNGNTIDAPVTLITPLKISGWYSGSLTIKQGLSSSDPNVWVNVDAGGTTVKLFGPSTYAGGTTLTNGSLYLGSASAAGTGAITVKGGVLYSMADDDANANHSLNDVILTTNGSLIGVQSSGADDAGLTVNHKFGGLVFSSPNLRLSTGAWNAGNDTIEFAGTSYMNGESQLLMYHQSVIFSGPITGSGTLILKAYNGGTHSVLLSGSSPTWTGGVQSEYDSIYLQGAQSAGTGEIVLVNAPPGVTSGSATIYSLADDDASGTHGNNIVVDANVYGTHWLSSATLIGQQTGKTDNGAVKVTHTFGAFSAGLDGNNFTLQTGNASNTNDVIKFTGAFTVPCTLLTLNTYQDLVLEGTVTANQVLKTGAGALTLNGANAAIASFTMNNGTVNANAAAATGNGPVAVAGGVFNVNAAGGTGDGNILLSGTGAMNANVPMAFGNIVIDAGSTGGVAINANAGLGNATLNLYAGNVYLNESNALDFGTLNVLGAASHVWVNKQGALGGGSFTFNTGFVDANVNEGLIGPALLKLNAGSTLNLQPGTTQVGAAVTLNGGTMISLATDNVAYGMNVIVTGNSTLNLNTPTGLSKTVSINDLTFNTDASGATISILESGLASGAYLNAQKFQVAGTTTLDGNAGFWINSRYMGVKFDNLITGPGMLCLYGNNEPQYTRYFITGNNEYTGGTLVSRVGLVFSEPNALGTGPIYLTSTSQDTLVSIGTTNAQTDHSGNKIILTGTAGQTFRLGTGQYMNGTTGAAVVDPNFATVSHKYGGVTFTADAQMLYYGTLSTVNVVDIAGPTYFDANAIVETYRNRIILSGQVTGPGKLIITSAGASGNVNSVFLTNNTNNYSGGTDIRANEKAVITVPNALGTGLVTLNGGQVYSIATDNAQANHSSTNIALVGAGKQQSMAGGQGYTPTNDLVDDPNIIIHTFGNLTFTADAQTFYWSSQDQVAFSGTITLDGNSWVRAYRARIYLDGQVTGSGPLYISSTSSSGSWNSVFLTNNANNYTGGTLLNGSQKLFITAPNALPGTVILDGNAGSAPLYSIGATSAQTNHGSTDVVVRGVNASITGTQGWNGTTNDNTIDDANAPVHKFGNLTFDFPNSRLNLYGNDAFEFAGTVTLNGTSQLYSLYTLPVTLSGSLAGSGTLELPWANSGGYWATNLIITGDSTGFTGSVMLDGSHGTGTGTLVLANPNALGSGTIIARNVGGNSNNYPYIYSWADTDANGNHGNDIQIDPNAYSSNWCANLTIIGKQIGGVDDTGVKVTHTFGTVSTGGDGNFMSLNTGNATNTNDVIKLAGINVQAAQLTLNTYQDLVLSGAFTGTGAVVKAQNGALTLNGANATITGFTSTAGTVNANAASATGDGPVLVTGGVFNINVAGATGDGNFLSSGGATYVNVSNAFSAGSVVQVVTGGLVNLDAAEALNSAVLDMSGTGTLMMAVAGSLGSGDLAFNGGIVDANVADALAGTTKLTLNVGSTLRLRYQQDTEANVVINGGTLALLNTANVNHNLNLTAIGTNTITLPTANGNNRVAINNLFLEEAAGDTPGNLTIGSLTDSNNFVVNGLTTVDGNNYLRLTGNYARMNVGNLAGAGALYVMPGTNGPIYIWGGHSTGFTGNVVLSNPNNTLVTGDAFGTGTITLAGTTLYSFGNNSDTAQTDHSGNNVIVTANSSIIGTQFMPAFGGSADANVVTHQFGGLAFAAPGLKLSAGTWPETTDVIEFTGIINLPDAGTSTLDPYQRIVLSGQVTGSGSLATTGTNGTRRLYLLNNSNNFTGSLIVNSGQQVYIAAPNAAGAGVITMNGGRLLSVASQNSDADHSGSSLVVTANSILDPEQDFGQNPIRDDGNAILHKFGGLSFSTDSTLQVSEWGVNNDAVEFTGTSHLDANGTLNMYYASATISGQITGAGSLTMVGSGGSPVLKLSGNGNDFTGGIFIQRNVLELAGDGAGSSGGIWMSGDGRVNVTGGVAALGTGPVTVDSSITYTPSSDPNVSADPNYQSVNFRAGSLHFYAANSANSATADILNDGLVQVHTGASGLVGSILHGPGTQTDANFSYARAVQVDDGASLSAFKVVQNTVTVGIGSKLTLRGGAGPATSIIQNLTIAGATDAWTGLVDIGTSYVYLPNATEAQVGNQIKQGSNFAAFGSWDGTGGITSGSAAGNQLYGVGYADNANLLKDTFGEANGLPNSGVLVRFTYVGDTNLDGITDLDKDYYNWSFGYLNNIATWQYGDFNYDGVVDLDKDYYIWSYGYLNQGAPLVGGAEEVAGDLSGPASAPVPEPGTLALVGLGLAALLRRRGVRVGK